MKLRQPQSSLKNLKHFWKNPPPAVHVNNCSMIFQSIKRAAIGDIIKFHPQGEELIQGIYTSEEEAAWLSSKLFQTFCQIWNRQITSQPHVACIMRTYSRGTRGSVVKVLYEGNNTTAVACCETYADSTLDRKFLENFIPMTRWQQGDFKTCLHTLNSAGTKSYVRSVSFRL